MGRAQTRLWLFATLAIASGPAFAGTVYLNGGSVVQGDIKHLEEGQLTVATDFAGALTIAMDKVRGLVTEEPVVVTLHDGDVVRGRLAFAPEEQQRLISKRFGATPIRLENLLGLRLPGTPSPAEQKLAAIREEQADLWSGRLLLGITGTTGNAASRSISVGAKTKRATKAQRLYLSLRVDRAQEDGEPTAKDTVATARLEFDVSKRFYVYGQTEIESAEFENVAFRSTTTIGPGYYFIQQEDHTLKGRFGLGYEYVDHETGDTVTEAVLTLGYDYMIQLLDWVKFTHELTIAPKITNQPTDNFRVESLLGLEMALGEDTGWSVLVQYKNEYKNNPVPGVERMDTSYLLNLVRIFE